MADGKGVGESIFGNLIALSATLLGAFTLTLGVDFAGEWAVNYIVN